MKRTPPEHVALAVLGIAALVWALIVNHGNGSRTEVAWLLGIGLGILISLSVVRLADTMRARGH